jgi:hypothetical protein
MFLQKQTKSSYINRKECTELAQQSTKATEAQGYISSKLELQEYSKNGMKKILQYNQLDQQNTRSRNVLTVHITVLNRIIESVSITLYNTPEAPDYFGVRPEVLHAVFFTVSPL